MPFRLTKMPPPEKCFLALGLDPGVTGGLACIAWDTTEVTAMPKTEREQWDWVRWYGDRSDVFAYVEKIPPAIFAIGKASMAKLYGSYMRLRAFLIAASIPFEAVEAKVWQRGLGIPARNSSRKETDSQWKNRLKAKAEELFPRVHVTLATADALLIAEYCRRTYRA